MIDFEKLFTKFDEEILISYESFIENLSNRCDLLFLEDGVQKCNCTLEKINEKLQLKIILIKRLKNGSFVKQTESQFIPLGKFSEDGIKKINGYLEDNNGKIDFLVEPPTEETLEKLKKENKKKLFYKIIGLSICFFLLCLIIVIKIIKKNS